MVPCAGSDWSRSHGIGMVGSMEGIRVHQFGALGVERRVASVGDCHPAVFSKGLAQARMSRITFPWTSLSRKSLPPQR